jgi:DNA polymerase III subunit epsilon
MRMIVFDTEATDLEPGQICQLSYLIVDNNVIKGKNMFFSVDEMSTGAFEVHNMSMNDLRILSEGRYFEHCADEILADFSSCDLIAGHNVACDERYLRVELERCGIKLKKLRSFCTMNYATGLMNMKRKVAIGRPKPPKLEELAEYYKLSGDMIAEKSLAWFGGGSTAHDARFDTAATYLCIVEAIRAGDLRGLV